MSCQLSYRPFGWSQDWLQPYPDLFEIPGFRVALAIASLPGMTIQLYREFLSHHTSFMKTVTLSVASRDDVSRRVRAAFRGKKQGAHISFASVDLLWQTLTKKRRGILKVMTGQDAKTLRELARRVGRDVKAVHRDVHALLDAGVLDRTEDGRIHFRYSAVRVDFTLHKEVA